MGAPSKGLPSRGVVVESRQRPRRCDTSRFGAFMRAALLHLALVAAFAFIAEPALAKVVKKGAYGAIALQRETGQLGYAYNAATKRALAVATPKRSQVMRDVPTVAESGLPGYDVSLWY